MMILEFQDGTRLKINSRVDDGFKRAINDLEEMPSTRTESEPSDPEMANYCLSSEINANILLGRVKIAEDLIDQYAANPIYAAACSSGYFELGKLHNSRKQESLAIAYFARASRFKSTWAGKKAKSILEKVLREEDLEQSEESEQS